MPLLRFDRHRGDRPGLEPPYANGLTGFLAVTIGAAFDAAQGLVDLGDQLAGAVAGATRDAFDPDPGEGDASLAVPLVKMSDGGPDWEETAAAMRARIATLEDPADTELGGSFKRDNRDVLNQMRDGERDAWNSVERCLGERDRELRERTSG